MERTKPPLSPLSSRGGSRAYSTFVEAPWGAQAAPPNNPHSLPVASGSVSANDAAHLGWLGGSGWCPGRRSRECPMSGVTGSIPREKGGGQRRVRVRRLPRQEAEQDGSRNGAVEVHKLPEHLSLLSLSNYRTISPFFPQKRKAKKTKSRSIQMFVCKAAV